ncbi:MAG TPA: universal stress protein [Trebonia sp.]|jgi:nucleotide-binding universal stress UspA family protein|nr:universal stress protein [Trebonia sp.]
MTTLRDGIVAGYDGSPGSDEALSWAVEEAETRGCALTVCMAWAPEYMAPLGDAAVYDLARQRGETILATGIRRAKATLGAESVLPLPADGPAAAVLCEQSTGSEMVVLGARGHGGAGGRGVRGLNLGSVAWQVSGHARGPVVVVRGEWRVPHLNPGPVVAGTDGSPASANVLEFAFREAELRDVPLVAVCALADAPATLANGRRVQEDFDHVLELQAKAHPEVPVLRQVAPGSARTALLDATVGAQLLVIGARGRGGLSGMSLGSVAHVMLHHAPCPVAVLQAI